MPRDLPIGNGSLLVAFDRTCQIRDLYWPHVGLENHALGHPFRVGLWVDGNFRWMDDERWERDLRYRPTTLVTQVKLHHPDLNLTLNSSDAVDFHENLLIRRFDVTNQANINREIRLFFHQDFHISGNDIGDTAISTNVRDTYSYMWPRDCALVSHALTQAGYLDFPRAFFQFCERVLAREGYLLHKYNADGTLASSWHPWVREGQKALPIQEDETALVLWALWQHFDCFSDVYFIKPLYRRLICPVGDFLADFRDRETGLPLPSYDLWEERYGVSSWTVAATWASLEAAANFTESFGEMERATRYWSHAAFVSAVQACLKAGALLTPDAPI